MKKRIYLAIAALILFTILGVEYYNYYRTPADTKVAETTALPAPAPTPGADNVYNTPAQNTTDIVSTNTAAAATKHYRHHKRYASAHRTGTGRNKPVSDYDLAANGSEASVAHEVSGDYFGNTQKVKDKKNAAPQYSYTIVKEDNTPQPRHKVHFGAEIGLNQNNFTNNNTPNISTLGFHAGGVVNIELGRNIAFQPALMYIRKGNRLQSETDVDNKEKLTLGYLQLPAYLVCKFGNPDNGRFMIGAGPYASYLVNATDKFQASGGDGSSVDVLGSTPATPNYRTDRLRQFDLGIGGFIGCETPEGIYAKAGAQLGLTDIQHNANGSWSNRNYTFLVSVGYLIGYEK